VPAQGRLGDKANTPADAHGCPACPHPALGPAIQGSPNVNVNGRPALRVDDRGLHGACCGPNTWTAQAGSRTVFINGKPAHRMNDAVRHCGGMGKLVEGSPNVIVGDSGDASRAAAGGGAGSSASTAAPTPQAQAKAAMLRDAASDGTPFSEECPGCADGSCDSDGPEASPATKDEPAQVKAAMLQAAAERGTPLCEECPCCGEGEPA
jgi:uncharacterized Zn-binding protein involved in type VI secretion